MKAYKIIQASTTYPVTLDEVKKHLGIYHTEKDDNLTILLHAATKLAEKFTGKVFRVGGEIIEQHLNIVPVASELDYAPVTGVTSVKYFDSSNTEQTLSTSDYDVITDIEPPMIAFRSFPGLYDRHDAVKIRFVAGYATANDVPGDVRAAILLITGYLYDNPSDAVRAMPSASEYLLKNHKIR